jgi:hypothetical protein
MSNKNSKVKMPEHPGQPQWSNYSEWCKMKSFQSIDLVLSQEETRKEQFERFNLDDEQGDGWGDASEAQDAGWGLPNTTGGSGW